MSLLTTLATDHDLLMRLMESLELSIRQEQADGRVKTRDSLTLLLQALERHDALEALLLRATHPAASRAEERAIALVAVQHRLIDALRREIRAVLKDSSQYSVEGLKTLVLQLILKLKNHFKTEEAQLWPLLRQASQSVKRSPDHALGKRMKLLE